MRKLAGMRVTAGFSQDEVAKALGMTQSAISLWERQVNKPDLDKVNLLANLYGVTGQDILDACTSTANAMSVNRREGLDNDGTHRESVQNEQK